MSPPLGDEALAALGCAREPLLPLTFEAVLGFSRGEVVSPACYDYLTLRPEPRGLYQEEVFGPYRAGSPPEDDRSERWGHLALAAPCRHPLDARVVIGGVPVLPPRHRRFFREDEAAAAERQRERRAWLTAHEERLCDPVEKILAEEGPAEGAGGPNFVEPPVNFYYRRLVNHSNALRRFRELGAPKQVVAERLQLLSDNLGRLFDALEDWICAGDGVEPESALRAVLLQRGGDGRAREEIEEAGRALQWLEDLASGWIATGAVELLPHLSGTQRASAPAALATQLWPWFQANLGKADPAKAAEQAPRLAELLGEQPQVEFVSPDLSV